MMEETGFLLCKPAGLLILVLLYGCYSLRVQSTDTLYFKSGLQLSGELDHLERGMISFSSDDLDDQDISTYKISTLCASTYTYRITTLLHKVYYGTLGKADSGMVKIQTRQDTLLIQLKELSTVASYDTGFFHNLSGTVALGYVFTRSASLGILNTYNDIRYFDGRIGADLNISGITGFSEDGTKRVREYAWLVPGYYLNSHWQVNAIFSYQRNLELGTARRFIEGAGATYQFLLKHHMDAGVLAGLATVQESAFQGQLKTGRFELPLMFTYNLYLLRDNNFQLQLAQGAFFGLNEGGRIREEGWIRAAYNIISTFSVNLVFYNSFDNQPPLKIFSRSDYGLVFGVGYSF
ncbi:Outer membrane protein beta-barrel domain-containing protein [Chitinophaga arvensicola]|uniref:Outer membrane protein beta-barrel domain-containing protein n=1 Tax=Chitinophaga arvensicola TaxID=29529 RepID=A0A1I0SCC9_9BACT|nr:Outer membrane protein beta-barrel domain-containing protein [Chitinophaga arvensicola]